MISVICITYFVLEIIINTAGDGAIVSGFRASLQIATLIYPGTKIIRHTHWISRGEFPPKWMMAKFYKMEKDGDIEGFFQETHGRRKKTNQSINLI